MTSVLTACGSAANEWSPAIRFSVIAVARSSRIAARHALVAPVSTRCSTLQCDRLISLLIRSAWCSSNRPVGPLNAIEVEPDNLRLSTNALTNPRIATQAEATVAACRESIEFAGALAQRLLLTEKGVTAAALGRRSSESQDFEELPGVEMRFPGGVLFGAERIKHRTIALRCDSGTSERMLAHRGGEHA
jgi:hypothetical protein